MTPRIASVAIRCAALLGQQPSSPQFPQAPRQETPPPLVFRSGVEAVQIELVARLYDAGGQIVRLTSEPRSSRAARRRSGGHGFTLRLPLDDVPEGSYVLHVEARSERNEEHRAARTVPIRVRHER
jgi:hypothetical protein